ncbi:MAG: hypothetical protein ACRCTP_03845 [Aeromonas popoffii]|uniref:hypothetical protein n=1 Tax=Aeromonas popoffii TaxID=70856 RepID=UPI003F3E7E08
MMQYISMRKKFIVTVKVPTRGFGNNRGSKEVTAGMETYGVVESESKRRVALCRAAKQAEKISRLISEPTELEIKQHFECHVIIHKLNLDLGKDAWGDYFAPDTIRALEMFEAGFMTHYNGEAL